MPKLASLLALFLLVVLPASAVAEEDPPAGSVLGFSPSPVDFGKTTTGSESQTVTVDVENVGPEASVTDKISVEGADSAAFKVNSSNCGWLEAGGHCSIWVVFAPGSDGVKNATLVVERKEQPAQSVPLTGIAVPAALAFTPGSYDFGIQRTNQSQSTSLQITNSGEAPTQVGSLGIGGPDPGNFWIGNNDCWNGRWLQPSESCYVQVNFNAWDMTTYQAQVQVGSYGATFTADLAGMGGRAVLEPGSNPFDLGSAAVGDAGPVRTITLTNNGNFEGGFFIAVIAGGDVASFQLVDENCTIAPVAPGAGCTVHVRFTPQSTGPKAARLALFGESDGGTMVALTGVGTPAEIPAAAGFEVAAQAPGSPLPPRQVDGRSAVAGGPDRRARRRPARLVGTSLPAVIAAVLFDIDGTLLVTGGAGAVAWQRAFLELYEVEANIEEHTHAGMTDPEIAEIVFREVIGRDGSERERAEAIAGYLSHLQDAVDESAGYLVMPGIEDLLERLAGEGRLLGLVTGNIEPAAHIKLARANLNRYFAFGGYGSDARDRTELTKKALERGGQVAGSPLDPDRTIAVGDTPRDVKAGHGAGIRVVGVATGSYSVEELEEAGADWAIPDVQDGFPA
jgi:phosphoglycolate phosphatase-like HAD superfamily hydrolase